VGTSTLPNHASITVDLSPTTLLSLDGATVRLHPAGFHDFYAYQGGDLKPVPAARLAQEIALPERTLCGNYRVQGMAALGLPDGSTSEARLRIAYGVTGETPYSVSDCVYDDLTCLVGSTCTWTDECGDHLSSCEVTYVPPFMFLCFCKGSTDACCSDALCQQQNGPSSFCIGKTCGGCTSDQQCVDRFGAGQVCSGGGCVKTCVSFCKMTDCGMVDNGCGGQVDCGPCCAHDGQSCESDDDCCGFNCENGTCGGSC
jgi:hypothetical protein